MKVSPLGKPAGQQCPHQKAEGCAIYHDRPNVCREWHCMWIRDQSGVFGEEHRPDKLGVFFTASPPDPRTGQQIINAHETYPAAAMKPAARKVIGYLQQFAPVRIIPGRKALPPKPARLSLHGHYIS